MKQSRIASLVESIINIVVGFGISVIAQAVFLPMLGVPLPWSVNLAFAGIMTVISIARSYALRRVFEALHIRRPLSPFMQAVVAERFRQIEVEGWSIAHDDKHDPGTLARAGAAYLYAGSIIDRAQRFNLINAMVPDGRGSEVIRALWDWSWDFWKPKPDDRRRDLVRGVALGIAEGERLDRQQNVRRPS